MSSVENAIKHINYTATKKSWCKTRYNLASDEVKYNGIRYYKSFSYLSDRSEIYTYIESYLEGYNIPYTIETKYNDTKLSYDRKLLFTIKIA